MIICEKDNQVLLKYDEILKMGENQKHVTVYEWWKDMNKMLQGIYEEYREGNHLVYCIRDINVDEEMLIEEFEHAFPISM